jgi:hypothetical protein
MVYECTGSGILKRGGIFAYSFRRMSVGCSDACLRTDSLEQYLAKNPNGYCGIGGCGVPFKSAELQVGEKA